MSASSRFACVLWSRTRFSFGSIGVSEEMLSAFENCVSSRYFTAAAAAPAARSLSSRPIAESEAMPHLRQSHAAPCSTAKYPFSHSVTMTPRDARPGQFFSKSSRCPRRSSISSGMKADITAAPPSFENVPARSAPPAGSRSATAVDFPSKRQAAIFPPSSEFSGSHVPGVTTRVTSRSSSPLPSGSVICSHIATR